MIPEATEGYLALSRADLAAVETPAEEAALRMTVVAEAMSWAGTPYHHGQRVKGAGVDCALYLAEVYHRVGLIPEVRPGYYPGDWHMHRNDERYLREVLQYARKIDASKPPLPGDVAMYQFGRCAAHGSIVIAWPIITHSILNAVVSPYEADDPKLAKRFRGIYRYKDWA